MLCILILQFNLVICNLTLKSFWNEKNTPPPHTHTPTRLWRQAWTMIIAIQPTHKSDFFRLTEDKISDFGA